VTSKSYGQQGALLKQPHVALDNVSGILICRRPDGCEMSLLFLATPYGVAAAIGTSAAGFRRTPRLARLRGTSSRERAAMPLGAV
jgi:hypothetical protein